MTYCIYLSTKQVLKDELGVDHKNDDTYLIMILCSTINVNFCENFYQKYFAKKLRIMQMLLGKIADRCEEFISKNLTFNLNSPRVLVFGYCCLVAV